ncbi:MAG: hypothetical protein Q8P74_00810, partial [bacterium]|nr:hypothetical protein [bacterium]
YFLFLADFFQIREINTAGLQKILPSSLKLSVQERTGNKILFFPSRSIFLVNIGEIERDILGEFPSLVGIDISRDFPDSLNARVVEREGLASFCLMEDCFIVDKEGIAFEAGNYLSPIIKTSILTGEVKLGDKVIDQEELKQLLEINFYLERDLNIALREILISPSNNLTALTQEGWEIYLNLGEETKWQLTKLKLLLGEKIPPEKRGELEWIELRFGNFANPKYKD